MLTSWPSLITLVANHTPQPSRDFFTSISRPRRSAGRMAARCFHDDGLGKNISRHFSTAAVTTHPTTGGTVHGTALREVSNLDFRRDMESHVGLAGQRRRCLARDFASSCNPPSQTGVDDILLRYPCRQHAPLLFVMRGFLIIAHCILAGREKRRVTCFALSIERPNRPSKTPLVVKPPRRGMPVFQVHDAVFYHVILILTLTQLVAVCIYHVACVVGNPHHVSLGHVCRSCKRHRYV